MSIKGFTSQQKKSSQEYVTLQPVGAGKYGIDTIQRAYFEVGTDTVEAGSTDQIITATAHGALVGDAIRFAAGTDFEYYEVSIIEIVDANNFKLGHRLSAVPSTGDGFSLLRSVTPTVSPGGAFYTSAAPVAFIDELDAVYLDPSVTTIPRSSNNAIQVVASLAAACTEIQSIQDIGDFMALYLDAARTQKICNLPLTPDEKVSVSIPVGSTIYLGAVKDADITAASTLILNFIG